MMHLLNMIADRCLVVISAQCFVRSWCYFIDCALLSGLDSTAPHRNVIFLILARDVQTSPHRRSSRATGVGAVGGLSMLSLKYRYANAECNA